MSLRRVLPLLVAVLLMAGCDAAAPGDAATVPDAAGDASSDAVTGSYARGLITGRRSMSPALDQAAFMDGVRDGLTGADQRYTDEQLQAGLEAFAGLESAAANAEAEANVAAGRTFLASNRERAEVTETASGLQYEVVVEGDGARPTETSVVRVHYRGTTLDGETFDASYDRGEPAEFPLNRVIPGWTEGLQLMSVGSTYRFWIPADIGYGMQAPPGAAFGPGSTLAFEVELLEIVG